jgi:hypothetical protein
MRIGKRRRLPCGESFSDRGFAGFANKEHATNLLQDGRKKTTL